MLDVIKKLFGLWPKVDYSELVKQGSIVVDVRSNSELAGWNIKDSVNIPVDQISKNVAKLKGKNKAIIICCASGMRSASAKSILKSNSLIEVYNGGSWISLRNKV